MITFLISINMQLKALSIDISFVNKNQLSTVKMCQSIKAVFSHTIMFELKYLSYHHIKPSDIFTRGS